jgi:hypothetical protein
MTFLYLVPGPRFDTAVHPPGRRQLNGGAGVSANLINAPCNRILRGNGGDKVGQPAYVLTKYFSVLPVFINPLTN